MPKQHRGLASDGHLYRLLAPACLELVVLDAVLVAHHLPIELVHQFIDCGVQVFVGAFRKQVAALDPDRAFRALAFFLFLLLLHSEQHLHIHHLIEVAGDAIKFGGDVTAQRRRNFEMVTADRQIHKGVSLALGNKCRTTRVNGRPEKISLQGTHSHYAPRPQTRQRHSSEG